MRTRGVDGVEQQVGIDQHHDSSRRSSTALMSATSILSPMAAAVFIPTMRAVCDQTGPDQSVGSLAHPMRSSRRRRSIAATTSSSVIVVRMRIMALRCHFVFCSLRPARIACE
jgi:hypothetical protein